MIDVTVYLNDDVESFPGAGGVNIGVAGELLVTKASSANDTVIYAPGAWELVETTDCERQDS